LTIVLSNGEQILKGRTLRSWPPLRDWCRSGREGRERWKLLGSSSRLGGSSLLSGPSHNRPVDTLSLVGLWDLRLTKLHILGLTEAL
jgi:hypothetical protein